MQGRGTRAHRFSADEVSNIHYASRFSGEQSASQAMSEVGPQPSGLDLEPVYQWLIRVLKRRNEIEHG